MRSTSVRGATASVRQACARVLVCSAHTAPHAEDVKPIGLEDEIKAVLKKHKEDVVDMMKEQAGEIRDSVLDSIRKELKEIIKEQESVFNDRVADAQAFLRHDVDNLEVRLKANGVI